VSIPRELVHSYALGCLWVVTVFCKTVGRLVRAFCRPHAYTFNEQSKMATVLTPQTDVTSEKVTWLMEIPRQQSRPAYRKINRLKTNINISLFFIISLNLRPVTYFSTNKHSPSEERALSKQQQTSQVPQFLFCFVFFFHFFRRHEQRQLVSPLAFSRAPPPTSFGDIEIHNRSKT